MKTSFDKVGKWLYWPSLIILVAIAIFKTTNAYAYFTDKETAGSSFFAGIWEPKIKGTSISAEKTAEGFLEIRDGALVYGVRGEVCVTNGGEIPTDGLQIVDMVQYKNGPGQFQDYFSFIINTEEKPILEPEESHCYPYEIVFDPVEAVETKYRNSVQVTILNHSGWMPVSKHCEGPELCPFGPNPKADFDLPDKSFLSTVISLEQDFSSYILEDNQETPYGAQGEICITNNGYNPTQGLSIKSIVQVSTASGEKQELASTIINTEELEPEETACYFVDMAYGDTDEPIQAVHIISKAIIYNYNDWLPGDWNCPGPDFCSHGPLVDTELKQPEEPPVETEEDILAESPTDTSIAGEFLPISFEGIDGTLDFTGEVCIENIGANPTEGLNLTIVLQNTEDQDNFQDIASIVVDLSDQPVLEPASVQCYPYQFSTAAPETDLENYQLVGYLTINNHTGWMPGSQNCPGEGPCSFGPIITIKLVAEETQETPVPTETPIPTETPVPTETPPVPTEEPTEEPEPTPEPEEEPEPEPTEEPEPEPEEEPEPEPPETP